MRTHYAKTPVQRLIWDHFRVADSWAQAIRSNPAIVARAIRGEKGGAEIEAACLIHHEYCGLLRLARFP